MDEAATRGHGILSRFATAAWGVCGGVLLATIITATMIHANRDTHDHIHAALLHCEYLQPYEVVPWQERYERSWYMLACVCGALGAWLAGSVRPPAWLAMIAVIAFFPAAMPACRSVFLGKLVIGRLLTCAGILALPLLGRLAGGNLTVAAPVCREPDGCTSPEAAHGWHLAAFLYIPLGALLYGVFAPCDLAATASQCNTEAHVASYLVAPAQYYRSPDVVPGLDFESHYGIGHAFTFSWVMGNGGLQSILERYVLFMLVVSILYFLSAHLVLTDWLGNPFAAFGVTLALAASATEGLAYQMPSCWPVRHPFAFVFLFCAVRGVNCSRWCIAAGVVAGLSLFWQTDIGLFTLAAGGALFIANAVFLGGRWSLPGVFAAAGLGSFLALCVALFGPRVISVVFAERLLEPLLLYATGFGTALMNWRGGWSCWFNLAGPVVAIASVGAWIGYRRTSVPPRGVIYAAVASLLGLAMLTKWVNRSLDVLWSLNGGLLVTLVGWWLWVAWRTTTARMNLWARVGAGCALLGVAGGGVWLDSQLAQPHPLLRSTSPLVRITDRLETFPNPINAARRGITVAASPPRFSEDTVNYLRDHTGETERVAVISAHDWSILAAAGRAPRLSWMPLFLVHSPVLLDRCAEDLANAERVFVSSNALVRLARVHPSAHARLVPILNKHFEPVETACGWTLYRRKAVRFTQF